MPHVSDMYDLYIHHTCVMYKVYDDMYAEKIYVDIYVYRHIHVNTNVKKYMRQTSFHIYAYPI